MKIALQLYSVGAFAAEDFYGTLKRVADIGYRYVEFAGFHGQDAKTVKAWLDELGLEALSNHGGIDNLQADIPFFKEIGLKHHVLPASGIRTREDVLALAKQLNEAGKLLAEHDITLSYHNHDFEFAKDGDEYLLDILYANTDPRYVHSQLDLFWVTAGGEDAVEYFKKYKDRSVSIHFKEMTSKEERRNTAVGDGCIDFKSIIAMKQPETFAVVEIENPVIDVWEAAKRSFAYLSQF